MYRLLLLAFGLALVFGMLPVSAGMLENGLGANGLGANGLTVNGLAKNDLVVPAEMKPPKAAKEPRLGVAIIRSVTLPQ